MRRGRLQGRPVGRRTLIVAGHDRGDLVVAARGQRALGRTVTGPGVEMRAVLCFAGAEWCLVARPLSIDGVVIFWPKALVRALARQGPLGPDQRGALAARIADAFPPCTAPPDPNAPDTLRPRSPHWRA